MLPTPAPRENKSFNNEHINTIFGYKVTGNYFTPSFSFFGGLIVGGILVSLSPSRAKMRCSCVLEKVVHNHTQNLDQKRQFKAASNHAEAEASWDCVAGSVNRKAPC